MVCSTLPCLKFHTKELSQQTLLYISTNPQVHGLLSVCPSSQWFQIHLFIFIGMDIGGHVTLRSASAQSLEVARWWEEFKSSHTGARISFCSLPQVALLPKAHSASYKLTNWRCKRVEFRNVLLGLSSFTFIHSMLQLHST